MFLKPPVPRLTKLASTIKSQGDIYYTEKPTGQLVVIDIVAKRNVYFYNREGNTFKSDDWSKDKDYFERRLKSISENIKQYYIYFATYRTKDNYRDLVIYAIANKDTKKLISIREFNKIISLVPKIKDMFCIWEKTSDIAKDCNFPVDNKHAWFDDMGEGYLIYTDERLYFYKDPLYNAKELYGHSFPYINKTNRIDLGILNEMTDGKLFKYLGLVGRTNNVNYSESYLSIAAREFLKKRPKLVELIGQLRTRRNKHKLKDNI